MIKGKVENKPHTMVVGLAISVMLSWSCPVLAHGPKQHKHSRNHQTTTGVTSSTESDTSETLTNPHSNKGGKLRGHQRANEVAGEHGEQGRGKHGTDSEGSSERDTDTFNN
jgi:hypothetical protein